MIFLPCGWRVDCVVHRLAASQVKLRRFGLLGKGDPGECASDANRRHKQFQSFGRKIDKDISAYCATRGVAVRLRGTTVPCRALFDDVARMRASVTTEMES
jgi:hypothetical protein